MLLLPELVKCSLWPFWSGSSRFTGQSKRRMQMEDLPWICNECGEEYEDGNEAKECCQEDVEKDEANQNNEQYRKEKY